LKWYDGGGENGITSKGFLRLKCLSPLKMLTSPLFEETLGDFLSLPFFAPSLEDLGVLMIFEKKITSSKTSFQMASRYWQWMHILEWSYACHMGKP
jgi:ATP-dependent exoDNAse (exonuclease V) beta subunit